MPELSESEIKALRHLAENEKELMEMFQSYQRASWLGRLLWKLILGISATVAAIAAFKDHILSLFKGVNP